MTEENKIKFLSFARLQSPRESCGLLVVRNGREHLILCKNKAAYDQQFIICPNDYVFAEQEGAIIGVVHSHPMSSPQPSEADRVACAQSGLKWFIVGCLTGEWFEMEPHPYEAPLLGREWCHGLLDCYSLIRDYYRVELNISIPDYDRDFEWWLNGKNLYEENFRAAGFEEVDLQNIAKHDVILMQVQSPVINHGGVFLGGDKFIHHLHGRLSSRDILGGYYLKSLCKVLRHKELTDA